MLCNAQGPPVVGGGGSGSERSLLFYFQSVIRSSPNLHVWSRWVLPPKLCIRAAEVLATTLPYIIGIYFVTLYDTFCYPMLCIHFVYILLPTLFVSQMYIYLVTCIIGGHFLTLGSSRSSCKRPEIMYYTWHITPAMDIQHTSLEYAYHPTLCSLFLWTL